VRSVTAPRAADAVQSAFLGDEGAGGRVVCSWMLAGGIAAGGFLIGTLALAGRGNPGLHLLLAPVLFMAGTLLGFVQGIVFAVIGRPADERAGRAFGRALLAGALSVPLLPIAWLVSSAITVGSALQAEFRWSWLLVAAGGWIIGVSICAWAVVEAWRLGRRLSLRIFGRRSERVEATAPHAPHLVERSLA
jgi:hypothetical protein